SHNARPEGRWRECLQARGLVSSLDLL
ncbi:uncharacterized protein METZ01_LOCUS457093, partial [marine metagenome]